MANEYLYGTYGQLGATIAQNAAQTGTVVVYIGTAPVNLVRGYTDKVNRPVKLFNIADAHRKIGYSSNWETFTLCEAVSAHFNNPLGNIGPITVINVLDPDKHRGQNPVTKTLSFANGRAELKSDTIILDTLALDGLVEGVDYMIDYSYAKGTVIINSLDSADPITGNVEASYFEVTPDAITYQDIIGQVTADGSYTGLGALQLVYPENADIPNIIAAPGWSHIPDVYNAMIGACQQINGHWFAFVLADIPITYNSQAIDTIDKAKSWKRDNGYNSEFSKVFWPMAIDGAGQKFHLSTLAAVTMLRIDNSHDSVPMESPGNKQIPITKLFFGAESKNQGFDQRTANTLTSNGITTAVAWGGRWVIWGDHTAAYAYGTDVDQRAIFDVSIRMQMHIANDFQREWGLTIDQPMTRQLADQILNREQEKLDALVAMGALIGSPKVVFLESENSTDDMMNGDFKWHITETPTPPLKSASVSVAYTSEGFTTYFEGGNV